MSYCRWSSDDFQCDLYCYEDCSGGWTTHIAHNRPILPEPLTPWVSPAEDFEAWKARDKKLMDMLSTCERLVLDLPHAGDTFNDPTLEDFYSRLLYLRELGYQFPDHVLKCVQEEMDEPEIDEEELESSRRTDRILSARKERE